MKLGLFDDMEGIVLHERENYLVSADTDMRSDVKAAGSSRLPENMPLAMAYVPVQQWGEVYDSGEALGSGTLFPDLVFPVSKGGGR